MMRDSLHTSPSFAGGRSALFRARLFAIAALIATLATGCSTLQPVNLPDEHTPPPSHAALWGQLDADHQDDWFVLLNHGPEALDWRLRAIDSATESIDLQTFLWTLDTTGSLVIDHLLEAAERGVSVRLLVDDSLLTGTDEVFAELAEHPNVEYRVFNPFKRRSDSTAARWALNLAEFGRLDHRMHNKAMVVDNRVAIVGGRNLADEYFGLHGEANFRDMELIVGGPIVGTISRSFDDYWNDPWSLPIEQLVPSHEATGLDRRASPGKSSKLAYAAETPEQRRRRWQALIERSVPGETTLLVDRPPQDNPANPSEAPVQVADALRQLVDDAIEEILIVSAYLIPTDRLEAILGEAVARGVRVRILTNSIRSNNHLTAHSAYRNHIATLLTQGTELHEMRVDAKHRHVYMLSPVQTKALALHAKTLVVDRDTVFIGSPNLDPRSLRLNTEMGLLVESPELNAWVREAVEPDFANDNAWRLELDEDGGVVWVSRGEVLSVQPAHSFMQNIEDWFLSLLPIEQEL
jgi:putative cardiolipin synthase